jgi:hypothetical protein
MNLVNTLAQLVAGAFSGGMMQWCSSLGYGAIVRIHNLVQETPLLQPMVFLRYRLPVLPSVLCGPF